MKLTDYLLAIVIFLPGSTLTSTWAASVIATDFTQLVEQSELAVEATVTDLKTIKPASHGQMLFTEVTLSVERTIFGDIGKTFTIRLAGGKDGDIQVIIPGMPVFELNQRYILFLKPGFENTGTPLTDVNQGFLHVVKNPRSRQDTLLNTQGDVVIAVENNQLIVKRNPELLKSSPERLNAAPKPLSGNVSRAATSAKVLRYWQSEEAPLSIDDFVRKVRSTRNTLQ